MSLYRSQSNQIQGINELNIFWPYLLLKKPDDRPVFFSRSRQQSKGDGETAQIQGVQKVIKGISGWMRD